MSKNSERKRFTGVAYYSAEQWDSVGEVLLDAYRLPDSYKLWLDTSRQEIETLENGGFTVQKIWIEAEEFATWCQFRGQAPNTTAILLYVAERIKPTEDARRIDGRRRSTGSSSSSSAVRHDETVSKIEAPASPKVPPQLTARERVAQMRPDLACLFPSPL